MLEDFLRAVGYDQAGMVYDGELSPAAPRRMVLCPFHDDSDPSLSVGPGYAKCFGACNRGWKLEEAAEKWRVETGYDGGNLYGTSLVGVIERAGTEAAAEPAGGTTEDGADPRPMIQSAAAFLHSRGFEPEWLEKLGITCEVGDDGYVTLADQYGAAQRKCMSSGARFLSDDRSKGLFWAGQRPDNGGRVWLVESILDGVALALALGGQDYVAASFGTGLSDGQAYALQGRAVMVVYDADAAGYVGARKAAETLREFGAKPIVVDMPPAMGKDANEAWINGAKVFSAWAKGVRQEYERSDASYVVQHFATKVSLPVVSTTIPAWDEMMKGGFRPGVHVLGAAPKVGKTALKTQIVVEAALAGKRVLSVEYEIPKAQGWARVASRFVPMDWADIEARPHLIQMEENFPQVEAIAERIRIVTHWNVDQIASVARDYDLIVVDYLQRMPGKGKKDGRYDVVTDNVRALSTIGQDLGIVVLAISELGRANYNEEIQLSDFKESGAIEYSSQSATGMRRTSPDIIYLNVCANTRGFTGRFRVNADLGRGIFTEVA